MPEELAAALPNIKRLCEAMRIPILELDGYEADDIIGTIARQADEATIYHTYMVTPDKDFAQLVSPTTNIWKPGRKGAERELIGVQEVLAKWEVETPSQVIDILGLWGDSVDNIPGIPGVGEKTAKKFIAQFKSIENLLENTDQLKGKQKEKVEANKEQALTSKRLATIITDVPVTQTLDDLRKEVFDTEALSALFNEFEFRTLAKRLLGEASTSVGEESETTTTLRTLSETNHQYTLLDTEKRIAQFFAEISQVSRFCFDLETTGLNPFQCELLGIAFCWEAGTAYYLPYDQATSDQLSTLLSNQAEKVGHNLKYDLSVLHCQSIRYQGPFIDTMLIHSLIAPGQKHGMDALAESELHYQTIKLSNLAQSAASQIPTQDEDFFSTPQPNRRSKKKNKDLSMRDIPVAQLAEYACEDVDITLQLAELFLPRLEELGMKCVYHEVESPLLPVLTQIEHNGIAISQRSLAKIGTELQSKIDQLSKDIIKEAGKEFNLNSPKQLGEILFGEMQLVEKPKKTIESFRLITTLRAIK